MPQTEVSTALRMLADATSDGVILFDEHDRVSFVNEAAQDMLGVEADKLMGLSSHNVFLGYVRASGDALARLRTGDQVGVRGPDTDGDAFAARFVQFPSPMGTGADAGLLAQEPPTAIVIRDRRQSRRLRRLEEARANLRVVGERMRERSLLGHYDILRVVSREIRRANRDRESLSVVVVAADRDVSDARFEDWLTATLRAPDRAGTLSSDASDDGGDPSEITVTGLEMELDTRLRWGLVVLPGTMETGAHAVSLRLTTMARDAGLAGVSIGVASYERRGERDGAGDSAVSLVERAYFDAAPAAAHSEGFDQAA